MSEALSLLETFIANDDASGTKAAYELAKLIRKGRNFTKEEVAAIAEMFEWNDGAGHPHDIAFLFDALDGLQENASDSQREVLAALIEDQAEYEEAVRLAKSGDPRKLMERQSKGLRHDFPPTFKRGRGRTENSDARVEAFVWMTTVEGMKRKDAIDEVWIAEGKHRSYASVERYIDKHKEEFFPDFMFQVRAQRYRQGCRDDNLRPKLFRGN